MTYFKGRMNKTKTTRSTSAPQLTVTDIEKLPLADLSDRGIRPEVVERYNVRMSRSERDGMTPTTLYFPYYTQRNTLCGWKACDLTKTKNDNGRYYTIGKVGVDCKLFGQKEAESVSRKRTKVVYVEGEMDTLSVYQVAIDKLKGTKYEGKLDPFVVSLNCGTGNGVEATMHNRKFIESFDNIVLAFDNDESTPKEVAKGIMRGKECTEAVATALLGLKLFVAQYPDGCKDANDCLMDNKVDSMYDSMFFKAEPYQAEKVVYADQIDFESLIKEKPEGVYIHCMPKLMDKLHGFRKREHTVIIGMSGIGKTYVTRNIAYEMIDQGYRIAHIFLEEGMEETAQGLMAMKLQVSLNTFKAAPQKCKPVEELREAYDWMVKDRNVLFLDHFGSLETSKLMGKIKSMLLVDKVDFVLLDHLSMVISGQATDNERKELDMLMTEIAAFCASHDIGIISVSHLNRDAQEDLKNTGGLTEPKWIKCRKEQMRGSAALEQLAWNIIGIDWELRPDRQRGRIRLVLLKNRVWSYIGECDVLMANPETGVLEDASDSEETNFNGDGESPDFEEDDIPFD